MIVEVEGRIGLPVREPHIERRIDHPLRAGAEPPALPARPRKTVGLRDGFRLVDPMSVKGAGGKLVWVNSATGGWHQE